MNICTYVCMYLDTKLSIYNEQIFNQMHVQYMSVFVCSKSINALATLSPPTPLTPLTPSLQLPKFGSSFARVYVYVCG